MLRITIELVPSDGSKPTVIAGGYIVNDGLGTAERGNYYARFNQKGKHARTSVVTDWPRQKRGVWSLVREALIKSRT